MLDMTLFERSTRGTEPTAAGVSMVRFARSVLAGFERTRDEMAAEASGTRGRTSVGALGVGTPVLLAPAGGQVKARSAPTTGLGGGGELTRPPPQLGLGGLGPFDPE